MSYSSSNIYNRKGMDGPSIPFQIKHETVRENPSMLQDTDGVPGNSSFTSSESDF